MRKPARARFWSAQTCLRFGTGRHVSQWESGDMSPHSKLFQAPFAGGDVLQETGVAGNRCWFKVGNRSIIEKMKNKSTKAKKPDRNHPAFNKNAEPFFSIIMEGLKGEVDGEHFWDAVAENAVFEFLYHIPGFTNKIE